MLGFEEEVGSGGGERLVLVVGRVEVGEVRGLLMI